MALTFESLNKIRTQGTQIGQQVRQQMSANIVAALGLVSALAWNEAIKAFIDYLFPAAQGNALSVKFSYAIIITCVTVIGSLYVMKVTNNKS